MKTSNMEKIRKINMKIRVAAIILSVAMLLSVLSGCSGKAPEEETVPVLQAASEVPAAEPAESSAALPDLETLYNQGMEVLAQMGDEAPILFPETNIDYLNEFYPGLADIEMKQFYAGVAPVTNAPFEIILVEVADEADVPVLLDIFHARMDKESDDSTYPENAEAWIRNCKITSRGCYVFLAVLMDPCEIPAEFILD